MKIHRLFNILYILMERKNILAKELADMLEVSTKTIYRDIDLLCEIKMPIYTTKGKNGGIYILEDFVINKAILNEEDKIDINALLNAFNEISPNNKNSLTQLKSFLGTENKNWIEIDFSNWNSADKQKEYFNKLKDCIIYKKEIEFNYSNAKGESYKRNAQPLKLVFKGMYWYLYAKCNLKNEFRFFKLSRIKNLVVLNSSFETKIPNSIFSENEFYEKYDTLVKLEIQRELSFRVYDEFENIEVLENGDFIVIFKMPYGDQLFSYISSFSDKCKILSPRKLEIDFIKYLEKILKKYL